MEFIPSEHSRDTRGGLLTEAAAGGARAEAGTGQDAKGPSKNEAAAALLGSRGRRGGSRWEAQRKRKQSFGLRNHLVLS